MIVISNRYYGQIARCNNCGAILGYTPDDVNSNQNIRCPQCNFTLWVPFNPNYDGVIKDERIDKGRLESNNNNNS